MAKITQQDLESWKSALTPPPVHYLLHISLPFPDLLPWMKSERGLSPSQGTLQLLIELPFLERHIPTTLWLFCIFPSACGIDPDCLNGVMSPPGAAQRPLGCWGWDTWRLPEAGHSLQLVLMEMGCARRADRGWRVLQQLLHTPGNRSWSALSTAGDGCLLQTLEHEAHEI